MTPEDTLDEFEARQEECYQLFKKKQQQYGNTIHKTGVLGATVELIGACARLPLMVLRAHDHGRSEAVKLKDIAMDIHNYATILLIMIGSNNWEGRN